MTTRAPAPIQCPFRWFFSALRSHSAQQDPVYQLLVSASWKNLGSRVSVYPTYCQVAWLPNRLPYALPAQPSWEPVGKIIIVEDPGDLYNSHRGHMASIERRPGAKIEGVLNLPGVKEKIGQKVEKDDSNQFVVDLYVNGSVERDKNVTKKSSGNKYRFLSITKKY